MKILVIEAIGLHLGYLGCYGNEWVATPNLDRLASEGVVFDWHIADQPDLDAKTPWHERSVATGCYHTPGSPPRSPSTIAPRVLRCEKLASFANDVVAAIRVDDPWMWIEGPNLVSPWRLESDLLESYFDEDDVEEALTPWPNPPLQMVELSDADVLRLQSTYAGVVTFFDAQLGAILNRLPKDVLLCVTARSGLPLGEHGMIGMPRPLLHDELVHVPLLMRGPSVPANVRIDALTQPVDLLPTFLDSLGEAHPSVHGRSLWPLVGGDVESVRPYAVSTMRVGDAESWLLRTADRAFHLPFGDGTPSLFIKPEDRWEVNDLYQQQIESADRLEQTLRAFIQTLRDQPESST